MGGCNAIFLVWLGCCFAASFVSAGDYRGRPKPVRSVGEQYWNHLPTELLPKKHLPRHFDWCDVDGEDMCVSSWNQHIPVWPPHLFMPAFPSTGLFRKQGTLTTQSLRTQIYCGSCWVHGSLSMIQVRLLVPLFKVDRHQGVSCKLQ